MTTSTPLNTKVRLERDGYVATVTLDNPGYPQCLFHGNVAGHSRHLP